MIRVFFTQGGFLWRTLFRPLQIVSLISKDAYLILVLLIHSRHLLPISLVQGGAASVRVRQAGFSLPKHYYTDSPLLSRPQVEMRGVDREMRG